MLTKQKPNLGNPKVLIGQKNSSSLAKIYQQLIDRYGARIDFQPFTEVESISVANFRVYKKAIMEHTAFIFTNKISIDQFFKFLNACNIKMPPTTKYFFTNVFLQNYLQKYMETKKRKIFHGQRSIEDLFPLIKKHKKEKFMFPCSEAGNELLTGYFHEHKYHCIKLPIYKNATVNLDKITPSTYDVIVFFSPLAVSAFAKNFPDYKFEKTRLAAFGKNAIKKLEERGWEATIQAPTSLYPSMIDGLGAYLATRVR